jgi:dTDP-4-dehydrorhamnose 3,5-epimerase-like enzyme
VIVEIKQLGVLGDDRGKLIALEASKQIPFEIKRVFYIFDTQEGVIRGQHSHYKTKQFLVAVNGSCKVTLDDGIRKKTFELSGPSKGLFQDALVWGTMHDFSSDCVLMVLANSEYDDEDYIRAYDRYLEVIQNDS